jgi:putative Holliday junction resolvase
MNIIGVDVGTVRVGAAWVDSSLGVPFPLAVWERAQGRAEQALVSAILERKAELLVVGMPLDEDGERTAVCDSIERFARRVAKRIEIKVEFVDEAFSSSEAAELLRAKQGAVGTAKRGAGSGQLGLDAYAACLILERYCASLKKS